MNKNFSDVMIKLIETIASNSACMFLWGETEMPQCLKDKIEKDEDWCISTTIMNVAFKVVVISKKSFQNNKDNNMYLTKDDIIWILQIFL